MKRHLKALRYILLLLVVMIPLLTLSGCSKKNGDTDAKEEQFTWWITKTDSAGTFYEDYEDNVAVQWINNQYWDKENLTIGTEGKGQKMKFDFRVPIMGAESDNFNTMIATGEYPDIIDLSYASQSELQLYEDGVLLDITEYVEKYLPNYLTMLEEHPELKPFVTHKDAEGNDRFYSLYTLADNVIDPYQGYMYRRDWVVKYAQPTSYVWDWESEYVKANGHPKYTPLSAAEETNDYTGWKTNEITQFTSSEGENPEEDYADNVIFPSGTSDPITISDWEWMLEAFEKAIELRGYSSDSNAYGTTMYYPGFMQTGDLVSSFGGGGPMWYLNKDREAAFGGSDENFKTYLECLNNWYEKGWLDKNFETRASDMFFKINTTGVSQGKVGLFIGNIGILGTTIRTTCADEEDQKEAMVLGAALPINDVYGGEENKFVEPDTFYQQGYLGTPTGFTTALEGKDIEALFAMINWMYSREGGLVMISGLNEEQYASMEFEPDTYAELGLTAAYDTEKNEDGTVNYINKISNDNEANLVLRAQRMGTYYQVKGNVDKGYTMDFNYPGVVDRALKQWKQYLSTGYILDYNSLMGDEESSTYSKINTYANDYMGQAVPEMIKNGLSIWDEYIAKLNKYGPSKVTEIYESLIE